MNITTSVLEPTLELAGYFAAHALWSVSDGSTLIPILAFEREPGQGEMQRLVDIDPQQALAMLGANAEGASRAVLILDAHLTLGSGTTDGLVLEMVDYGVPRRREKLAIPYHSASSAGGFAIQPVVFIAADGTPALAPPARLAAFRRGVERHVEGARIWRRYAG